MKNLSVLLLCAASLTACGTRVQPNHVGVLMENYGKDGKSDFSLQKGRVNTLMPGTDLYQVPLWEQRADFADRVLHLKASDNSEFTSRPLYTYRVIEKRAIDVVFDNKHLGDGDEFMRSLEDNILETRIYDIMKEESRKYITDDLMANGGSLRFEQAVQKLVAAEFDRRGFELVNFSAQLDFSDKVKAKIDNRNEVNTNIAVLEQQITEQRKRNELEELRTQQNLIRAKGLADPVLKEMFIDKWDGKTPLYGDVPISVLKSQ